MDIRRTQIPYLSVDVPGFAVAGNSLSKPGLADPDQSRMPDREGRAPSNPFAQEDDLEAKIVGGLRFG